MCEGGPVSNQLFCELCSVIWHARCTSITSLSSIDASNPSELIIYTPNPNKTFTGSSFMPQDGLFDSNVHHRSRSWTIRCAYIVTPSSVTSPSITHFQRLSTVHLQHALTFSPARLREFRCRQNPVLTPIVIHPNHPFANIPGLIHKPDPSLSYCPHPTLQMMWKWLIAIFRPTYTPFVFKVGRCAADGIIIFSTLK